MFYKKLLPINFLKICKKAPAPESSYKKVTSLQGVTFLKRLSHSCFSVNCAKFLKKPFCRAPLGQYFSRKQLHYDCFTGNLSKPPGQIIWPLVVTWKSPVKCLSVHPSICLGIILEFYFFFFFKLLLFFFIRKNFFFWNGVRNLYEIFCVKGSYFWKKQFFCPKMDQK